MNRRTYVWIALCCCAVLLVFVHAVNAASSDSFTVTQGINTPDSEPPTIPGNFTATPVASTQIDLDWDASSDNIKVAGYQVFRDATHIATTTLTSFSDTGLSASTTYTYYITAFDDQFNISTPTPSVATTTLQAPATTTPTTTPAADDESSTATQLLRIRDLSYEVDRHSISISFDTTLYAQAAIRWGRTHNYEGGYTSSDYFRRSHETTIDGLQPGTLYEIEIVLVDRSLRHEIRKTLTISTEEGLDMIAPANVTDFRAVFDGPAVDLSWVNPTDEDFSHVRVLSSDRFYPTHEADGWLVYEGAGEAARDTRPLGEGQRRYYTIFTYDEAGNISSGAVTFVTRGTYVPPVSDTTDRTDTTDDTATSGEEAIPPTPTFTFDDLVFMQGDEERPSVGDEVEIDGGEVTVVSLPYELVPEHLKTIVVTLEHPDDAARAFSFLLRINAQKTAYEARIGPLRTAGRYPSTVAVFDYATRELFSADGTIIVEGSSRRRISEISAPFTIGRITAAPLLPIIGLLALGLFVLLLVFRRRRSEGAKRRGTFTPRSLR